ncbi:MAG: hypothetical protein ACTHOE_09920 [Conexibacter sp.]
MAKTVAPYNQLTEAERAETLERLDDLTVISQRAWMEERTEADDWREYVIAYAGRLGVRLWPSLLAELRDAAPYAPDWLRQEMTERLAAHVRVSHG